jgi:RNA recognition motif-containing protein
MKLYVGNLPHQITEEQLKDLFSEAGHVISVKIITDRVTGLPRGLAL